MTALHRKVLRDLWHLKGQVLAIALVITSGVATYVMSAATLDSLNLTRDRYYAQQRFADVFATFVRAPLEVADRLRALPDVDVVEPRIVAPLSIELASFPDPIKGQAISLPDGRQPRLNALFLQAGRLVEPGRDDEAVVIGGFADAHGLGLGDHVTAIVHGKRRSFRIVGIADSAEFVYVIPPGTLFPDLARWGVLWLDERALEGMFDMDGAFNDALIRVSRGGNVDDVIDAVDAVLRPYGGLSAVSRRHQLSHRYLSEEMRQLETSGRIFPMIFLGVSAFLLNVVLARLIGTQRDQIAILKAFGYSNGDIGLHFAQLAGGIFALGAIGGLAVGAWLGVGLTRIYVDFFQFPILAFQLRPVVGLQAILVAAAAVGLGAVQGVVNATRLTPAEGMRPPAPLDYRATLLESRNGKRRWTMGSRMILRNLTARPVRTLLAVTGIAFSIAILMLGRYQLDAIDQLVSTQFSLAQRDDLTAALTELTSPRSIHEVESLPGVQRVEGYRSVPVTLRHGHRTYRTSIRAYPEDASLRNILNADLGTEKVPAAGLLLTDYLAGMLHVRVGDSLEVTVLDGRRQTLELPVAGLAHELLGVSAYASLPWLSRELAEGEVVNELALLVEPGSADAVIDALTERPRIAGVSRIDTALDAFYDTLAESILIMNTVFILLAGTIAFGVVFNSARIALSERARELASLRILGYRTSEVSHLLLAEIAIQTLLAVPLGVALGVGLVALLSANLESELYRLPVIVTPGTCSFSATVVIVATILSCLLVTRRLVGLDLVEVLKTRE